MLNTISRRLGTHQTWYSSSLYPHIYSLCIFINCFLTPSYTQSIKTSGKKNFFKFLLIVFFFHFSIPTKRIKEFAFQRKRTLGEDLEFSEISYGTSGMWCQIMEMNKYRRKIVRRGYLLVRRHLAPNLSWFHVLIMRMHSWYHPNLSRLFQNQKSLRSAIIKKTHAIEQQFLEYFTCLNVLTRLDLSE